MDFDSLFPDFAAQCAQLRDVLLPMAFIFLSVGMIASTVAGHRSASAYLRTVGRTLAYMIVLTQLSSWGNQISTITDTTVREMLKADPTKVYDDYQKALIAQKSAGGQKSWWDKLFDAGTSIFEGVISAALYLFGLLAGVIVFYAYLVQKFILYLGYAFAPIFVGFLAVQTLRGIGVNYLLGLVGVMIWPLAWGAAAILTKGLIKFMSDQSFLAGSTVAGAAGYGFQNLIGVALLGVWLIFSTIAGPVIVQRALASGAQIGAAMLSGAATAATTAATTGATTAATLGAGGGVGGAAAGVIGGGAAALTGLAGSSLSGSNYSPGSALIGSLAQMRRGRPQASGGGDEAHHAETSPSSGGGAGALTSGNHDLSGDRAAAAVVQEPPPPTPNAQT